MFTPVLPIFAAGLLIIAGTTLLCLKITGEGNGYAIAGILTTVAGLAVMIPQF